MKKSNYNIAKYVFPTLFKWTQGSKFGFNQSCSHMLISFA